MAGELLSRLADAQAAGSVPQIALTGGTIADAVHREVARRSADSEVDWSRVVVWWGDERFVAPDDPDRNAGQARAAFLDAVGVDPANVHEMPSTADAADVDDAAAAYSATLREHGSGEFEVVMLGVGPDGHVASLFPGSPALDVDDRIAVGVTDSPKPPPRAGQPDLRGPEPVPLGVVPGQRRREGRRPCPRRSAAPTVHDVPAAGVSGHEETSGSSTAPPRRPSPASRPAVRR